MKLESSQNYYYRYKILSLDDISAATLERRLKKISNNTTSSVLLDLTEAPDSIIKNWDCKKQLSFNNYVIEILVNLEGYEHLANGFIGNANPQIHVQIFSFSQLQRLDKFISENDQGHNLLHVHFSPRTTIELNTFKNSKMAIQNKFVSYFWDFRPYNSNLKNSLTVKNIGKFLKSKSRQALEANFTKGSLTGLEIWNDQIPSNYELEPDASITWKFNTPTQNLKLSIIIPSFNNVKFLTNVIRHLIDQSTNPESYEIIIVEDGGTDDTSRTIQTLFKEWQNKVNLKFIYWSKQHPEKGQQNFFRAGLARNLGVRYSEAEKILFLDSDMLVPHNFVNTCLEELATNDLIQFQRFHIHQQISQTDPSYQQLDKKNDTYTEEPWYWSTLYNCQQWSSLKNYWKYTCTYALGIKKEDFLKIGRFKKYYVSYGFEDTDLGFEMHKLKKNFKLVKTPLFHLTAYDQIKHKNSVIQRMRLLLKPSALFYLQHLDPQIFKTYRNFYLFEKPLINRIRDLF